MSFSSDSRRRRAHGQRKPLTRTKSSFFGTIKDIVTAPLSWFSATEEFEDAKDLMGKRRRITNRDPHQSPSPNPQLRYEDRPTPAKRMRVSSPDRSTDSNPSCYLDTPTTAFLQNSPSTRLTPSNTLAEINPNHGRDALSPLRNQISRNMPVDLPPSFQARPLARDVSFPLIDTNIRDASMEPVNRAFNFSSSSSFSAGVRDSSMPPLSARPSFRLRSSVTPQPTFRDVSEPPPVTTLMSNPIFVHPPLSAGEQPRKLSSQSSLSSITLGSLVDSQRRTQSPVRQHSSLIFSQSAPPPKNGSDWDNTAQKTLQSLDVYKTPLVPSRLRSSVSGMSSSGNVTDMFSKKKTLVLMNDDRDVGRLGKKNKGKARKEKEPNKTKPYAGEGGVKKFLARQKKVQEEKSDVPGMGPEKLSKGKEKEKSPTPPASQTMVLPPPTDVFAPGTASSLSGPSSLRVGRTITSRTHITRPSRAQRPKFSAAFEEEEDSMDEDKESQKERKLLEEAAKHVPAFEIPVGFSFAKDTKLLEHDSSNAKEPPVPALPFSIVKSSPPSSSAAAAAQLEKSAATGPSVLAALAPFPALSVAPSQPEPVATTTSAESSASSSTASVPNFFASSKLLGRPPPIALVPSPLSIESGATSVTSTSAPGPAASMFDVASTTLAQPSKDIDNPLWEGDSSQSQAAPKAELLDPFAAGAKSVDETGASNTSTSFAPVEKDEGTFKQGASLVTPFSFEPSAAPAASNAPFSFSKPSEPPSTPVLSVPLPSFGSKPPELSPSATSADTFTLGKSSVSSTAKAGSPLFSLVGAAKSAAAEAGNAFAFGYSSAPKDTIEASKPVVPTSFAFSSAAEPPRPLFSSASTAESEAVESPKPVFGTGSTGFTFGQSSTPSGTENKVEQTRSTFSFESLPSPPSTSEPTKSTSMFSFGQHPSAPSLPTSTSFTFGGGPQSIAGNPASSSFSFGSSSARPMTPPRNENNNQDRMDESPTRDTTSTKIAEPRPILGVTSSFSFGGTSSSTFAQANGASSATSTASPFSFGASSLSPNPFGSATSNKPEENKPFSGGGGFGSQPSTSFSFGSSKPTEVEPPRPSTTGSFSFQSPTSTSGPFSFGTNANTNGFGSQPASAPGSPSSFSQPFAFGHPSAPSTNPNPFAFGSSQPASPATAPSSLPTPTFGGSSGSGFGPQPSSSFGTSAPSAPSGGGGSLFTIGAAPVTSSTGGNRQMKKLPNRRGGKR